MGLSRNELDYTPIHGLDTQELMGKYRASDTKLDVCDHFAKKNPCRNDGFALAADEFMLSRSQGFTSWKRLAMTCHDYRSVHLVFPISVFFWDPAVFGPQFEGSEDLVRSQSFKCLWLAAALIFSMHQSTPITIIHYQSLSITIKSLSNHHSSS